ncbi:MAG: serine/arginine repetitive matrix protein 2 [Oscillospiraceae bacterium]|jgi:hypothetical protein|nr:serine/arginine repetitive matrix protein 2 [Oscillospiraceae bacterium]
MAFIFKPQIKNFEKLQKQLKLIETGGKQAVTDTINDLKRRAPGWVATAVTGYYNIKKSEITPQGKGETKRKAGSTQAIGETLEGFAIVYKGRVLTPTHFKMRPTTRPEGKKKYSVTSETIKGVRKRLMYKGRKAFLGTTKARGADGVQQIPFVREGDSRTPILSIKSISLPQMVDNPHVRDSINSALSDGFQKRIDHNVQRRLGV